MAHAIVPISEGEISKLNIFPTISRYLFCVRIQNKRRSAPFKLDKRGSCCRLINFLSFDYNRGYPCHNLETQKSHQRYLGSSIDFSVLNNAATPWNLLRNWPFVEIVFELYSNHCNTVG